MPPPMLRMGSSSVFSMNTLVDSFPAEIVIDGHFLSEKLKVSPLLAVPPTLSLDNPSQPPPPLPLPPRS